MEFGEKLLELRNSKGMTQQALKLQQEQNKLARKERSKKEREEESDRLFEMKQQKKKEKHKGH